MSLFIPYHQYRVFKSLYILVSLGWIEYVESWTSQRISSLRCFRLGTHIRFPNHRVPWLSYEKSLVFLSLINYCISCSFASSSCLSQISASKVGSTSITTVASFTIVRLRYLISLCNSGRILLQKWHCSTSCDSRRQLRHSLCRYDNDPWIIIFDQF
jgi:hypothetical protein